MQKQRWGALSTDLDNTSVISDAEILLVYSAIAPCISPAFTALYTWSDAEFKSIIKDVERELNQRYHPEDFKWLNGAHLSHEP